MASQGCQARAARVTLALSKKSTKELCMQAIAGLYSVQCISSRLVSHVQQKKFNYHFKEAIFFFSFSKNFQNIHSFCPTVCIEIILWSSNFFKWSRK
jgi:predicted nucleotide-binding protein (sugar kinase/HSP70/actin superfamily)